MHTISDVRPFHRVAVLASVDVVNAVTPEQLRAPTPCAGWNLADLLAHMTVQHRGFAAAARGGGADPAVWRPDTVADAVAADPAGVYAAAAGDVLDAFTAEGVLDATFALPEFGPGAAVPGGLAIGFHFVDYVVHGWDSPARSAPRLICRPTSWPRCFRSRWPSPTLRLSAPPTAPRSVRPRWRPTRQAT